MIMLVDDEAREMDSYLRELDLAGFRVSFQPGVDEALQLWKEEGPRIRLLILDIMMPPGKAFQDVDTSEGLRTGVHLYDRVRRDDPDLPIVILTNVSDQRTRERFQHDSRCWFLRKEEYLPYELAEAIGEVLALTEARALEN